MSLRDTHTMTVEVSEVQNPNKSDLLRVLIARRWPGAIAKKEVDQWDPDIAASASLTDALNNQEINPEIFKKLYLKELDKNQALIAWLGKIAAGSGLHLLINRDDESSQLCAQVITHELEK